MKNEEEIVTNLVNTYFDEPDKSLKEVFGEYAEELEVDDRKKFFETLKQIIN